MVRRLAASNVSGNQDMKPSKGLPLNLAVDNELKILPRSAQAHEGLSDR